MTIQKEDEVKQIKSELREAQNMLERTIGSMLHDSAVLQSHPVPLEKEYFPKSLQSEGLAELIKMRHKLRGINTLITEMENQALSKKWEKEQIRSPLKHDDVKKEIYDKAVSLAEGKEVSTITDAMIDKAITASQAKTELKPIIGEAKIENPTIDIRDAAPQSTQSGILDRSVVDTRVRKPLPLPPPPENSLAVLESMESPLVHIFAPAPWFPEGKGKITVGSAGFKWYKDTDPYAQTDNKRASLPTGFYSGEDRPVYVVLRLETVILVWDFDLNVEEMDFYIDGISNVTAGATRWIEGCKLSASYSSIVVRELREFEKQIAK